MWLWCRCDYNLIAIQCEYDYKVNVITIQLWLQYHCDYCVNVITVLMWLQYQCNYSVNVITVKMWLQCTCGYMCKYDNNVEDITV